jgi:glycerophosphoryl diester phosphodiesterase
MYADGLTDICQRLHTAGLLVDVWTLDAGTPDWQNRLARAVEAGVDVVTTNTARELSAISYQLSANPSDPRGGHTEVAIGKTDS